MPSTISEEGKGGFACVLVSGRGEDGEQKVARTRRKDESGKRVRLKSIDEECIQSALLVVNDCEIAQTAVSTSSFCH